MFEGKVERQKILDERREHLSQEMDRLQIRERLDMLNYELDQSPSGSEGARIFLELLTELQPLRTEIHEYLKTRSAPTKEEAGTLLLTKEEEAAVHAKIMQMHELLANNGIDIGVPYIGFGDLPEPEASTKPVKRKKTIQRVPSEAWESFGTLEQTSESTQITETPAEAWEGFGTKLEDARAQFGFKLAEYKVLLSLYGPQHFISTKNQRDPNDRGIELIEQVEKEILTDRDTYAQVLRDLDTMYPGAGYDLELKDLLNKNLDRIHVQNEVWLENESKAVAAARELPPKQRRRLANVVALALAAAGLGTIGPYIIPESSRTEHSNEDGQLRGRISSTTPAPAQEVPPAPLPTQTSSEKNNPIKVSVRDAPLLDSSVANEELDSAPNPNNV